jgi:hypothetical protein
MSQSISKGKGDSITSRVIRFALRKQEKENTFH